MRAGNCVKARPRARMAPLVGCLLIALIVPAVALANPFATGASAAQSNILSILTPVAVIAVIVLGVAAWFNRISWGWMVTAVLGMVLVFGGPQVVAWIRGMFGV